jgi:hypothetical protein
MESCILWGCCFSLCFWVGCGADCGPDDFAALQERRLSYHRSQGGKPCPRADRRRAGVHLVVSCVSRFAPVDVG